MVKDTKHFPKDRHPTHLINHEGNLSKAFSSVIEEIFRKFDMVMGRELTFEEFRLFYQCTGNNIT